jgi:hypothetical protein
MRALLGTMLLLLLTACGDDSPPAGPQGKVTINGTTIDLGSMAADAERARVLSERALTKEDVERYLASLPDWQKVGKNPEEWRNVIERHGLGTSEWLMLHGRITAAFSALKMPDAPVPTHHPGDADVVRPFLDRIDAALKSR